eukprot:1853372-Amphidinium_carterae.1
METPLGGTWWKLRWTQQNLKLQYIFGFQIKNGIFLLTDRRLRAGSTTLVYIFPCPVNVFVWQHDIHAASAAHSKCSPGHEQQGYVTLCHDGMMMIIINIIMI